MASEHPAITFLRLHATFTRGVSDILAKYDSPLVKAEADALIVYYTERITHLTKGLQESREAEPPKRKKIFKDGRWQETI